MRAALLGYPHALLPRAACSQLLPTCATSLGYPLQPVCAALNRYPHVPIFASAHATASVHISHWLATCALCWCAQGWGALPFARFCCAQGWRTLPSTLCWLWESVPPSYVGVYIGAELVPGPALVCKGVHYPVQVCTWVGKLCLRHVLMCIGLRNSSHCPVGLHIRVGLLLLRPMLLCIGDGQPSSLPILVCARSRKPSLCHLLVRTRVGTLSLRVCTCA